VCLVAWDFKKIFKNEGSYNHSIIMKNGIKNGMSREASAAVVIAASDVVCPDQVPVTIWGAGEEIGAQNPVGRLIFDSKKEKSHFFKCYSQVIPVLLLLHGRIEGLICITTNKLFNIFYIESL
jgi:hypothetical protein